MTPIHGRPGWLRECLGPGLGALLLLSCGGEELTTTPGPLFEMPPLGPVTSSSPPGAMSARPGPIVPEPSSSAGLPLFGRTLLLTRRGEWVVVAVPDEGYLAVVEANSLSLHQVVQLAADAVPIRLVEDDDGLVHVVARGSGEVIALNPMTGAVVGTQTACSDPRGIAFDSRSQELVVACATGLLVWLNPTGTTPPRTAYIAVDLRDVAVLADRLVVSSYRHAKLFHVDRDGQLLKTTRPATVSDAGTGLYEPHVAHALVVSSTGRVVVQHQRSNIGSGLAAYYQVDPRCGGGVTQNAATVAEGPDQPLIGAGILPAGVVLDFALAPDGVEFAALIRTSVAVVLHRGRLDEHPASPCEPMNTTGSPAPPGATALTFGPNGQLFVQYAGEQADGARVEWLSLAGVGELALGTAAPSDPGRELFYQPSPRDIACASCHPEGGDDGTTWNFIIEGKRRTQAVAGSIGRSAPLHWRGDRKDMQEVLQDTLVTRMGGQLPEASTIEALAQYLDRLPQALPPRAADEEAVQRGGLVFERLGCSECHSGEMFTDNLNHDVGTGGDFQTPSLRGVAYRLPLMHDGCAASLGDRFSHCGGDARHGSVEGLAAEELDQLIAFMESL